MYFEVFYWRSSGNVVHRGASVDGGARLTAEGCNFDEALSNESHRIADIADKSTRYCSRCLAPELTTEQQYGVPA
jgi:hypothetical protein